jgi:hypothetical protein
MDDFASFSKIVQWLFGAVLALGGLIMKSLYGEIISLKDRTSEQGESLAEFKLHVSDNYAKEISTQQSLSRIHERIDKMGDNLDAKLTNVSQDIKELLKTRGK